MCFFFQKIKINSQTQACHLSSPVIRVLNFSVGGMVVDSYMKKILKYSLVPTDIYYGQQICAHFVLVLDWYNLLIVNRNMGCLVALYFL